MNSHAHLATAPDIVQYTTSTVTTLSMNLYLKRTTLLSRCTVKLPLLLEPLRGNQSVQYVADSVPYVDIAKSNVPAYGNTTLNV